MRRRAFVAAGLGAAALVVVPPLESAEAATSATLIVLVYADKAYPARPAGTIGGGARYVGPVQPESWLPGDEWVQVL